MVVWVYAGGGHAEVEGLIPLLQRHFPSTFRRCTPQKHKPGGKPGVQYAGNTGKTLAQEIRDHLERNWSGEAEVIVVVDDTDCDPNPAGREENLRRSVRERVPEESVPVVVGLAKPEIEAWIIAD